MPGYWELQRGPKVVCYILHTEIVPMEWAIRFRELLPHDMEIIQIAGQPFDMARNSGTQWSLDRGADFVFSLDSDVICPPDTVLRLMSHNLPIVSGIYYRRSPPVGVPVAIKNGSWYVDMPKDRLVEVDVVGAGCMLLRRDFLETLPPIDESQGKRWFHWRVDKQHLLPPGEGMSEDFSFNLHCRKHGFRIVVDPTVVCDHQGLAKAREGGFHPSWT